MRLPPPVRTCVIPSRSSTVPGSIPRSGRLMSGQAIVPSAASRSSKSASPMLLSQEEEPGIVDRDDFGSVVGLGAGSLEGDWLDARAPVRLLDPFFSQRALSGEGISRCNPENDARFMENRELRRTLTLPLRP